MGISLSAARIIAPTAWAVDFGAQLYGMLSSPNMADVHNAHLSFFSPQPYFIAAFFFPQQIAQLVYLWRLCRGGGGNIKRGGAVAVGGTPDKKDRRDLALMVDYAPYYAVGNLCIASWMLFWNHSHLKLANACVVLNTATQLYYVFARLPRMDVASADSVVTHVVAKTFAGIGVLDLLHNGSVAYFDHQVRGGVSTGLKVATAGGFLALGLCSDWILGACLVYDLVAIAVGQHAYGNPGWGDLLALFAGKTAAVVTLRNVVRPPYGNSRREGYEAL